MSATSDIDYQFVLCCLKHSQGKPDFHAVAKELGLKTHMTAYHRHWNIMKKAGIAGNTGKGRKPSAGASAVNDADTRGQKRSRSAKATPKTYDEEEEEEEESDEEEEENQENDVKHEPEHDSDAGVGTPAKKTKFGNAAGSEAAKNMLTSSGKK